MANIIFEKEIFNYYFRVYDDKPDFKLHEVNQVHGSDVHLISNDIKEGDGIVAPHEMDHPLAIKTADCLPIAVFGAHGVAMIHAGWKGLESKIIANTKIATLIPTLFFIGPHISAENYEVGSEFTNIFQNPDNFIQRDGKIYFSLFREISSQILTHYPNSLVLDAGICTYSHEEFHSYRLNKTNKRNWNILVSK